jgi:hypothetical protein
MKRITFLVTVVILLLLASSVLAMSSENYRLDWFTPMTGNGGGDLASANYAANFTVGQSVIGASSSANYEGCLGYWCGTAIEYQIYLPVALRGTM